MPRCSTQAFHMGVPSLPLPPLHGCELIPFLHLFPNSPCMNTLPYSSDHSKMASGDLCIHNYSHKLPLHTDNIVTWQPYLMRLQTVMEFQWQPLSSSVHTWSHLWLAKGLPVPKKVITRSLHVYKSTLCQPSQNQGKPPPWNIWSSPLKLPHSISLHSGVTSSTPPNK